VLAGRALNLSPPETFVALQMLRAVRARELELTHGGESNRNLRETPNTKTKREEASHPGCFSRLNTNCLVAALALTLCHAMRTFAAIRAMLAVYFTAALPFPTALAEEALPNKAFVDGTGPGWRALDERAFAQVNCGTNTWFWTNGFVHCKGQPVGVIRSTVLVTNFELVVQWRHLRSGGNSGVFVWATPESIKSLEEGKGRLPTGVEVQVLDHGYTEQYEKQTGKKADWFTSNGDVFPTGTTKMKPFPPVSPNGQRSFPRKNLSKGMGEWNHYYVRAINGEVRLWVNGEEVSGGTEIAPAWGYLCLESEGAPVQFRELRIRELP